MLLNMLVLLGTFLQVGVHAAAISNKRDGGPVVTLSYATFEGASSVWKRDKNILYLGSVHTADLAEVYGITGDDHLGTDALINFINHQDPNYPKGSTASSLLSKIAWPKYTVDSKQMLLFSDNATEEYTTIPDTYRAMLFGLYKN